MTETKSTSRYMQEGGSNLAGHNPLVLLGAFVLILRERFNVDQSIRYLYDPTVTDDDIPQGRTLIFINTEYDDEAAEGTSLIPRVMLRKGRTVTTQIAMDNLDQYQPGIMTRGNTYYHHISSMDIETQVIGKTRAESANLAYIVQNTITAGRKIIERDFYIKKVSSLSTSSTQAVQEADTRFLTSVAFNITYEDRWATMPIESPLKKYNLKLSLQSAAETLVRTFISPKY